MQLHRQNVDKIEKEDIDTLNRLLAKEKMEVISVVRLSLDLVHAASTLPQVNILFCSFTLGELTHRHIFAINISLLQTLH
jgi:hypothetical protein